MIPATATNDVNSSEIDSKINNSMDNTSSRGELKDDGSDFSFCRQAQDEQSGLKIPSDNYHSPNLSVDMEDESNDHEEQDDEEDEYDDENDAMMDRAVSYAMANNLNFSQMFPQYQPPQPQEVLTLNKVADLLHQGKLRRVMVLSGAGVSVSAGIPDFRSPGTGLYDNLQKYNLPYPEAVFDLSFFRENPDPFVCLASDLWPGVSDTIRPTLSHCFIKLLDTKGLLVRVYTQNIDGLEVLSGVSPDKVVECHGHFRAAKCTECKSSVDVEFTKKSMVEQKVVPKCPICRIGYVKPDIVFFGESLPSQFGEVLQKDLLMGGGSGGGVDLLIVMGTSLQVAPVSMIPDLVPEDCIRLLFNRELVGSFNQEMQAIFMGVPPMHNRDVCELGDCDHSIQKFCDLVGWGDELRELFQHHHQSPPSSVSASVSTPQHQQPLLRNNDGGGNGSATAGKEGASVKES